MVGVYLGPSLFAMGCFRCYNISFAAGGWRRPPRLAPPRLASTFTCLCFMFLSLSNHALLESYLFAKAKRLVPSHVMEQGSLELGHKASRFLPARTNFSTFMSHHKFCRVPFLLLPLVASAAPLVSHPRYGSYLRTYHSCHLRFSRAVVFKAFSQLAEQGLLRSAESGT